MEFWIDIEDGSGNKQGPGPLVTATSWQHVRRLSRAGEIGFSFIATDSRAGEVQNKRVAKCYTTLDGAPTELGAGIIDDFTKRVPAGQISFTVSGDDLLRELAYRTVGELLVSASDNSLTPRQALYHDPSTGSNTDLVSGSPITITNSEYVYVGYFEPFDAWAPTISVGNTNAGTLAAQYFKESEKSGKWITLSITDGTVSGGATLGQSGTVSWTRPSLWAEMYHNDKRLYWVRFQPSATTTAITFTNNVVTGDGETTTGPADIIAFAPSGWSLDTVTGYNATSKSVKYRYNGESVLAAFVKLAELSGERFRLGAGRKVIWLQSDEADSGVRAFGSTGDDAMTDEATVCIIRSLTEESDTYANYVGRVYAIGQDDITLEDTTKTAPSGWTLGNDSTGYYLQHDSTWSTYGIDTWKEWLDADDPDTLYEFVFEYIDKRKDVYSAYKIDVIGLQTIVYPGETIYVEYRRIVDGYEVYNIASDFTVLEVTTRLSAQGIKVESMTIASEPRYPDNENEAIAEKLL